MYYLVYKIVNKTNGKYYIGKHQTPDKADLYMGSGKLIKYAIKKYGVENFVKEILRECETKQEMLDLEAALVVPNKIDPMSYNIAKGGYEGCLLFDGSDEHLELCRLGGEAFKKKLENKEFLMLFSEAVKAAQKRYKEKHGKSYWENRKHKPSSKDAIGLANSKMIGEKNSQYGTVWVYNPLTNENLRIKKTDVVPEGYVKGRIVNVDQKCREAARKHSSNMMWITNVSTGEIKKVIKGEVPVGWTRGRKGFSANKRLK